MKFTQLQVSALLLKSEIVATNSDLQGVSLEVLFDPCGSDSGQKVVGNPVHAESRGHAEGEVAE